MKKKIRLVLIITAFITSLCLAIINAIDQVEYYNAQDSLRNPCPA